MWYRQPAKEWVEALPIGSGKPGAMVFGGVASERLQLNEDTLWAGAPYDPASPEALIALPEIRRLIDGGAVSGQGGVLSITGADEVVLLIAAAARRVQPL